MTFFWCFFCEVIAGRLPGPGPYGEWRDTVAISPLRPVTPGHLLVIPRQHIVDAASNPQLAALTMERAAILAGQHESADIITSIGSVTSQTILHLHLHVVPRRNGDGLHLPWT